MREFILCADDFGQNNAINQSIMELIALQRINATSCLVNFKAWESGARMLKETRSTCLVGLHFNLTLGSPLSDTWKARYGTHFAELKPLIALSYTRQLNTTCVIDELHHQYQYFVETMGAPPDFIDGHEHVHQLPGIREHLIRFCKQQNNLLWIRNTSNGLKDMLSLRTFPKRQAITLLGGIALRQRLIKNNLPTNKSFSGIYPFSRAANYAQFFEHFLKETKHGGLIMCHPGRSDDIESDSLAKNCAHEIQFLKSEQYLTALARHRCLLKPAQKEHH